jgi:hypothetical protein
MTPLMDQPASQQIGQPDPPSLHMLAQLRELVKLGRQMMMREEVTLSQMALTSGNRQSRWMRDWPVQGGKRLIVPRTGYGQTTVLTTAATRLLPSHEARLGLTIVNIGANAVTLWLCELGEVSATARPQIWLGSGGGSWDGRLGVIPWCGEVCAVAAAGGTTVTIAEV